MTDIRKPIAYISGPMSGIPEFNHPAFAERARELRAAGWIVLSPAEHDGGTGGHSREHYMRFDLQQVLMADAVMVLDGWENSAGARLEVAVAHEIGIPVYVPGALRMTDPTLRAAASAVCP